MKLIHLKKLGTTLKPLIVLFIGLIVSSCPIRSQSLNSKDSVVVISKAAAEQRLIELKAYRIVKQMVSDLLFTDSIQSAIIANDSLKFKLTDKELAVKDSIANNYALMNINSRRMYQVADKEVTKQKLVKIVSWIVSAALAVLLIIK